MPFKTPLADDVFPFAPLWLAGEPWACACVVWAGGFWEENLELMLDIQEFLLELVFESGGVILPGLSELPRLNNAGRLRGIFCGAVGVDGGGEGEGGFSVTTGPGFCGFSSS